MRDGDKGVSDRLNQRSVGRKGMTTSLKDPTSDLDNTELATLQTATLEAALEARYQRQVIPPTFSRYIPHL